ncbi:MAG: DUF1893 domain-containing protein [Epulopiscium sp.]|nr:DUF1893 domain-containing protein [Candidatus Epulonipiscium sp.]
MSLHIVKDYFYENNLSCVIAQNQKIVFTSKESGVKPLLTYIQTHGTSIHSLIVADRIIGKAAALLASYLHVQQIYTPILSVSGKEILDRYGIQVEYETLVPYIQNRAKTGPCPMEILVSSIATSQEAYEKIAHVVKESF